MIDLYAMGSLNVVKIYIAPRGEGLPSTVHPVDVFGEERFEPEFLKLNPNAKVPVITDHEGPGGKPYAPFESGVILLYLAEKTGQFLPKDPVGEFDAIQWMMVQMTLVGPMFGQYVYFMRCAPKGNDYALDRYRTQVRRVLTTLEQRLGVAPFLCGQSYSVAISPLSPGARGRHLPRQARRSRLPQAHCVGHDDQKPARGGPCLDGGRQGAGKDDGVRQGRRGRQRPPL
jgi:GST-like protein